MLVAPVIAQMSPASQGEGQLLKHPLISGLLAEDDLKPFRSRLVRFIDKQTPYCCDADQKARGIMCTLR